MTVSMLEASLTVDEMAKWRQYYAAEPFGQARDNWHMGTLAALYMQVHGKKGANPKADDFMYRTADELRNRQTRATMSALMGLAKPKKKAKRKTAKRRRTARPQTKGGE